VSQLELTTIIKDNEGPLLRYAWRYLKNEATAQDAVQEAFIRFAKQNRAKILNPRAWLFKAVRNQCLNMLKKQKRKPEVSLDELNSPTAGKNSSPDAGIIHDESRDALTRCFNLMKPNHREIIILKIEHGKSYKEIAEIMQLSTSNVGFILHTAMKQLQQNFREELSK
jgi:RNA polymerase sigma-70 factor (ECF subfamily)